MTTYLFVWNPDRWDWANLEDQISELRFTGQTNQIWSCRSHKTVRPNDRAFLCQVGRKGQGIIGSGTITTYSFMAPHWNGSKILIPRVNIQFDVLLNPSKDAILSKEVLKTPKLEAQEWSPQGSGITIRQEIVDDLEKLWFDFLKTYNGRYYPFENSEVETLRYPEGAAYEVRLTRYERNPQARKDCLLHWGYACQVCETDFEKVYGEIGKDYIHVHHVNPLCIVRSLQNIDPIFDLRPVCPNCHAMLHKRENPFTIEELRNIIKEQKNNSV